MGKYIWLESALKAMGGNFFFDAVAIRPGETCRVWHVSGQPVFGLPGNPVSTMVTFELFVAPAIDCWRSAGPPRYRWSRHDCGSVERKNPGSRTSCRAHGVARVVAEVKALKWQGSGDIAALAKANCFLVLRRTREKIVGGRECFRITPGKT